ncbi:MAG: hypothetical protein KC468_20480, partial [Myxococcales bacterium]|nr:hypothetical protein [Myxococcales bacterium]
KSVVRLVDGHPAPEFVERHLIGPLDEVLAPMGEKAAASSIIRAVGRPGVTPRAIYSLKLVAPIELEFAPLIDILYTSGRAGFNHFFLAVAGPGDTRRFLEVDPPMFTMDQPPPPSVKIFVLKDGIRVWSLAQAGSEPTEHGHGFQKTIALGRGDLPLGDPARWNLPELDQALEQIKRADPEVVDAVISGEHDIPLAVFVEVLNRAAGDGCPAEFASREDELAKCRFPYLSIEAGSG